jgi:hypothetical protein
MHRLMEHEGVNSCAKKTVEKIVAELDGTQGGLAAFLEGRTSFRELYKEATALTAQKRTNPAYAVLADLLLTSHPEWSKHIPDEMYHKDYIRALEFEYPALQKAAESGLALRNKDKAQSQSAPESTFKKCFSVVANDLAAVDALNKRAKVYGAAVSLKHMTPYGSVYNVHMDTLTELHRKLLITDVDRIKGLISFGDVPEANLPVFMPGQ